MFVGMEIRSSGSTERILRFVAARMGRKVEAGLQAVGNVVLEESKKLCPRDTDALIDSGRSTLVGIGLRSSVVVGYGGKDFEPRIDYSHKEGKFVTRIPSEYAVFVHEIPGKIHDPGQDNFLREPTLTKRGEMSAALVAAVSSTT